MVVRPSEVHGEFEVAKVGVLTACRLPGVQCNCNLSTQWKVDIDGNERASFLELAREEGIRVMGRTA